MKKKKIVVEVTRSFKDTKEFGKISRIVLPDKSKIYISKNGWNLVTPKGIEIKMPYNEINIALKETMKMGYVVKEVRK